MKNKKTIIILVSIIALLSVICSLAGLFLKNGIGEYQYQSINNETIEIYGRGLYNKDSVSTVAQGKASDAVTLILGIPLLVCSLIFTLKGSFRAKLLLTGTIGYFLYTYMSYSFLWMYNKFFILYVILMSASFFSFIILMISFDLKNIKQNFKDTLPVKFIGGFQIVLAAVIGLMWLGKIAPSIMNNAVPSGLEHYTTLVIQGMDLGFIVPTALLSGICLIKRKQLGYLLSSVIILKGVTMLTSITTMIINQAIYGVKLSVFEIIIFPLFNILAIIFLIILFKNIIENREADS